LPELPEVETMVRGIRHHVINRPIRDLIACQNSCKPISLEPSLARLRHLLLGETFVAVRRLGKRVVFDVSDGGHLVIEPRMTGLMVLKDPPDTSHLRLQWDFEGPGEFSSLWFWDRRGLGTVTRFEAKDFASKLTSIGRDALEMKVKDWQDQCQKTAREIKIVLLDQKIVAGIGNIYASEILHRAGIGPERAANSLESETLKKLAKSSREVLSKAIACEGSTLGDGTYRNALNQTGSYQNHHRVYMREGEACLTCRKGRILRVVQGQRSTFFCPLCQT